MDTDIFDIYGDLEEFDTNEELKNAKITIEDLQSQVNKHSRDVEKLNLDNEHLSKEYDVLSKNYSSLLKTAKLQIQRKDNEINSLRKEKEDICFRRFKHAQKPQLSQFIQTDVTIGATDLLNVQRLGKHIENNVTSESSKHRNLFTDDKLIISTRAKTSIIQDKTNTSTSHHRKQPESNGSRSRSPVRYERYERYESSKEKKSRNEPRDYKNHARDIHSRTTRSKGRRISEERKHRYDDRQIDSGQDRTTKRDRYEAQDRTKKQDVVKHKRYEVKQSVQPAVKDARDIIKMKRARESSSNERESKKRRSKSTEISDKLVEKMSKIFGEESSSEIYLQENQQSCIATDQCSNEQSESNNLDPTVSSTTVLLPEYAQRKIEIDLKFREPKNYLAIAPSVMPSTIEQQANLLSEPPITASSEVSSTFEQASLPQGELKASECVLLPNRVQKSLSDSLVKPLETKQQDEPKMPKLKVPAKKMLKKILPKLNKADSDIESSVRAADLVEAIILDPRLLKPKYCQGRNENLKVITAFPPSADRMLPVDSIFSETTELNSAVSLFPVPPSRTTACKDGSNPDQMKNMNDGSKIFTIERDIPMVADTNLVKGKVNNRLRARGKSMCIGRFANDNQQGRRDSITVSLAELKECAATSRPMPKRSLSMYKELPQPNKKHNYSENMSLIKSIIDFNKTKSISASDQESIRKNPDFKTSKGSNEKSTTKLDEFRPITTLGRIPKIVKQTLDETKHEAATRNKTMTVKKDTIAYSTSHETKNMFEAQKTNKKTLKIPQTKADHVKISNKTEEPTDTKKPRKESVQECKVYNQDDISPILFELLSFGTTSKHDQDTSREIVASLNTTEPKQVAYSCSLTDETTEKKVTMKFCSTSSVGFMKSHIDQPNTVDKSSEDKTTTLDVGKDKCKYKFTTEHSTENNVELSAICDKTEESIIDSSIDAKNRQTEIPVQPHSSGDKKVIPEPLVQPLPEISNDFVVATPVEPVVQLSKSKHRSRKSSEHSKMSVTTLPLDITSSSNSNMDIDLELELMHGMTTETRSYTPLNVLPPCVDNGSLIVPVDQKPKIPTDTSKIEKDLLEPQTAELFSAVVLPCTKTAADKCLSELTATTENSDHIIQTPTRDAAQRCRLKSTEVVEHDELEKSRNLTTPADNSTSDKGTECIQKPNDESLQSDTSPLQANRVYKSAGRVMYYVEQAQDGSNEETMFLVRKKKKKKKQKVV